MSVLKTIAGYALLRVYAGSDMNSSRHHVGIDAVAPINCHAHTPPISSAVSRTPVVVSGNDNWITAIVEPADHANVAAIFATRHDRMALTRVPTRAVRADVNEPLRRNQFRVASPLSTKFIKRAHQTRSQPVGLY